MPWEGICTMPIQPRPLPQETVEGLRPPLPGYPYFAHADYFPFRPHATGYSAVNSWWLADASFLVYGTSDFILQAFQDSPLPRQGFGVQWIGTAADNRGMILSNEATIVVVFRGTRLQTHNVFDFAEVVLIHEDDLWTDSQFLPAACRVGGRVHEGFRDAYAEISDRLDAVVSARRSGQSLWLTGHSLGGALATLAAAHFADVPVQGTYTFGCPRVGDKAFGSVLPRHAYYRFVHRDDWVPTVPPELLGYVHAGTLHCMGSGRRRKFWQDVTHGAGRLTEALRSMAKEMRWDMGELPFKVAGLADHAAIYYATLLWNDLLESPEARMRRISHRPPPA